MQLFLSKSLHVRTIQKLYFNREEHGFGSLCWAVDGNSKASPLPLNVLVALQMQQHSLGMNKLQHQNDRKYMVKESIQNMHNKNNNGKAMSRRSQNVTHH